jgi:hypothetical protein
MCDPVTIGLALASTVASAALAPKAPNTPKAPDVAALAPKQQSKAPNTDAVKKNTQEQLKGPAGYDSGSTFLTGTGGVDPSTLNLGKTMLLGG